MGVGRHQQPAIAHHIRLDASVVGGSPATEGCHLYRRGAGQRLVPAQHVIDRAHGEYIFGHADSGQAVITVGGAVGRPILIGGAQGIAVLIDHGIERTRVGPDIPAVITGGFYYQVVGCFEGDRVPQLCLGIIQAEIGVLGAGSADPPPLTNTHLNPAGRDTVGVIGDKQSRSGGICHLRGVEIPVVGMQLCGGSHSSSFWQQCNARPDKGSGHMGGVIADCGCIVDLCDAIVEVRVTALHSAPVPLTDGHAVAFQRKSGRAAGPHLVSGDGVGGIDVVGNVELGSEAGNEALQFQHFAVGQFTSQWYTQPVGYLLCLALVFFAALPELFRKRLQFCRASGHCNVTLRR